MYLTVKETEDEHRHIGTLDASSDRELMEKLHKALDEHFNEDVIVPNQVKLADCCRGLTANVAIELEDYSTNVKVEETWLY